MKKVTGQFNQIYELDDKTKQEAPEGTSYAVVGKSGYRVMMLKDRSKSKQLALEAQIAQSAGVDGCPSEIVYSHNKMAGYLYSWTDYAPVPDPNPIPIPDIDPNPDYKRSTQTSVDSAWIGYVASGIILLVMAILQIKVFYPMFYRWVVYGAMSDSVKLWCINMSFSGFAGLLGGILLAGFLLLRFVSRVNNMLLPVITGAGFAVGDALICLLIVVIVNLVGGVFSLIMAIVPTIITILVLVYLVKLFFHR